MNTQQLLETLSNCITIDTTSGNLYIYGNLQQGAVKSALLYANADGKIVAAPDGVGGGGGGLTEVGLENLTATGVRNNTTYLRGDNTWATINYQPLDADLTAIAGLADSSGLLRKVDSSPSWVIDSAEYMTIEVSDLRYIPKSSKRDSLVANNTSLIYSVTAVNNALGDKMDVSGGTFTGNLTINSSEPSLIFNDSSSGGVYRFMVDGGQFFLKYGTVSPVTIFTVNSSGAITLESTITSSGFKVPDGTASQFLKANGTVDSTSYQPLDADLTAIAGLADSSGLLRKVDATPSWIIDTEEYMTILASDNRYVAKSSKRDSLVANNTSLFYSVTAVNNALADKMNTNGGTFTGDLTVQSSYASLILNDTSSGGVYRFMSDGGQFYLKYGTSTLTTLLTSNSSGAFTLASSVTATSFIKSGGTSAQFLKADGSVDSSTYITSTALSSYLTTAAAATTYQPLNDNLTAITGFGTGTGILKKINDYGWALDTNTYLTSADLSNYQLTANLSTNLTASASKYPSVNAVNTGLALKLNLSGGTLSGGLTLTYSVPTISLNDNSAGVIWNILNDGSTFKLNNGATNKFYIFNNGNAEFANNLTAAAFVKSGGTSAQFLKADGSVDSSTYLTQTSADARYLYATSNPNTAGNFVLSIGNNGTYSYVQSHSGQPLELNPVGNTVRIAGNIAIHAGNIGSYTAGGVSWDNVSSKPASWLTTTNLIYNNAPDTAVPSGFWQDIGGSGNPVGTWFNYINVRHSNPGNVHGYQLGMSYYDNDLWFRSYQGSGTYQSWAKALSSQNYSSYALPITGGTLTGNRSIQLDTGGGSILVTGNSGGWSMGTYYKGSDGVIKGGFGAYGGGAGFNWLWIGVGYDNTWAQINSTSFNTQVPILQSGNQVLHAGNYNLYTDPRYVRKDTTGQYLKPFYEYSSYIGNDAPSTLTTQMGGGGLRVDFQNPGPSGSWSHTLTWSGYNRYSMCQIGTNYYTTDARLYFRQTNNHDDTWSGWKEIITSGGGTMGGTLTADFNNGWGFRMNRGATTNYLGVVHATAGTNNWFVGQREDGTNHYRIYNFQSTVNALSVFTDGNIQPYGWMRMGVFNQNQSNSDEAWIGRAADRAVGTMTVQLGGSTNGSRFEVVDYAWTKVLFDVNGSGNASSYGTMTSTAFYESSDFRLKTLIEHNPVINGIENLQTKLYEKNGKTELGYFAQDAEKYMPYAVTKNDDGYLNLSYREVHTAKIARLEQRVAELEKQLNLN